MPPTSGGNLARSTVAGTKPRSDGAQESVAARSEVPARTRHQPEAMSLPDGSPATTAGSAAGHPRLRRRVKCRVRLMLNGAVSASKDLPRRDRGRAREQVDDGQGGVEAWKDRRVTFLKR
jgi:hypothetical protein